MGLSEKIRNSRKKPEGFIGRMTAKRMNGGPNARLAEWGFKHIRSYGNEDAIDLGCGGGANIAKLLSYLPAGNVTGIDYSEVSVEVSRALNDAAIKGGRCSVLLANVSTIPLPDCSFHLATAFDTVSFWPDPVSCFREVLRILKPGGTFLIVNAGDGKNRKSVDRAASVEGMTLYNGSMLDEMLAAAGFSDIVIDDDEKKDRICVKAVKKA